jgi:hypothetical protein
MITHKNILFKHHSPISSPHPKKINKKRKKCGEFQVLGTNSGEKKYKGNFHFWKKFSVHIQCLNQLASYLLDVLK